MGCRRRLGVRSGGEGQGIVPSIFQEKKLVKRKEKTQEMRDNSISEFLVLSTIFHSRTLMVADVARGRMRFVTSQLSWLLEPSPVSVPNSRYVGMAGIVVVCFSEEGS